MEVVKRIATILDDKKAQNIEIFEVADVTSLTEYMVLATGTSSTQIRALAGYVEEILKKEDGIMIHHSEGYNDTGWILLDYGHVVVHVFEASMREHYKLEKLWETAKKIELGTL
ncbi:MAG: ribosome silencing factor [Clostridia bacterium]